jgi:hypothetical protein
MIAIDFLDHDTIAGLGRIADRINNPDALLKVVGRRGANELQRHFRNRNTQGNKLGGRRTNFWRQVADSVNSPVQIGPTTVRIAITHRLFLQKLFGGRITANRAGALTIPVDPLAYGRDVSRFQRETGIQLFLLRKKGGGFSNLLAGFVSAKQLKVFYILSGGVDQDKDPDALPDRGRFNAAILDEADRMLARQIRNGGTP